MLPRRRRRVPPPGATAGWLLVVVTNQPDIARGTTTRAEVDAINDVVVAGLPIAEVLVCPHDDADECGCRKPGPGHARSTPPSAGTSISRASVMVGDRWRDIEAGRRAGVRTFFVDHGYDEERPAASPITSSPTSRRPRTCSSDRARPSATSDGRGGGRRLGVALGRVRRPASDNPAQAYRRQLIIDAVERAGRPARVLDIGSGQGDLLAALATRLARRRARRARAERRRHPACRAEGAARPASPARPR